MLPKAGDFFTWWYGRMRAGLSEDMGVSVCTLPPISWTAWNDLLFILHLGNSYSSFKTQLKCYFLSEAFKDTPRESLWFLIHFAQSLLEYFLLFHNFGLLYLVFWLQYNFLKGRQRDLLSLFLGHLAWYLTKWMINWINELCLPRYLMQTLWYCIFFICKRKESICFLKFPSSSNAPWMYNI